MTKLSSMIRFSCSTSVKYVGIYYAILFTVVAFIFLVTATTGSVSGIEINTMVYIGVLGALGFKDEFRMFIQHGFTRKYIFVATLVFFAFIAGLMALIDTVVGNLMYIITQNYDTLYGSIYGYGNIFTNFILLFMSYMFVCCLSYVFILIFNRLGKMKFICFALALAAMIIAIVTLYTNFMPEDIKGTVLEVLIGLFGFSSDGTVNFFAPILTLLLSISCVGFVAYLVIRRAELR